MPNNNPTGENQYTKDDDKKSSSRGSGHSSKSSSGSSGSHGKSGSGRSSDDDKSSKSGSRR